MPLNRLYTKTLRENAERMEAGAAALRTAADLIERLACELERANDALEARGITPPMLDQPPQPEPKETQAERPSQPIQTNTGPTAAASVPAPSGRAPIPTVAPAGNRVDDWKRDTRAQIDKKVAEQSKPQSWADRAKINDSADILARLLDGTPQHTGLRTILQMIEHERPRVEIERAYGLTEKDGWRGWVNRMAGQMTNEDRLTIRAAQVDYAAKLKAIPIMSGVDRDDELKEAAE